MNPTSTNHSCYRLSVAFMACAALLSRAQTAEHPVSGAHIYQTYCLACHGANLEGATGLPLADANWKHGSSPAQIRQSIAQGFPTVGMPAMAGLLSPREIDAVTDYVMANQVGLRDLTIDIRLGHWPSGRGPAGPNHPRWRTDHTISPTNHVIDLSPKTIDVAGGFTGRPYAARVSGTLYVPTNGLYQLEFVNDAVAWIVLDGKKILTHDAWKTGGAKASHSMELTAGPHPFTLTYSTRKGRDQGNGGIWLTLSGGELTSFPLHADDSADAVEVLDPQPLIADTFPLIARHPADGHSPTAMHISFPQGGHLSIDPKRAIIEHYWTGLFIDIMPTIAHRGKDPAIAGDDHQHPALMQRWTWADHRKVITTYQSILSETDHCLLEITFDGVPYTLTVSADTRGFRYHLTGPAAPRDLILELASTAGLSCTGGQLTESAIIIPAHTPVALDLRYSEASP